MPFPAGLTPSSGLDGDLTVTADTTLTGAEKNYQTLRVQSGRLLAPSDMVVKADRLQVDAAGVIEWTAAGGANGTQGGTGGAPAGKNGGGGGGGGGYGGAGSAGGSGSGGTGGGGGGTRDTVATLGLNEAPGPAARGASGGAGGAGKDNTLDYGTGANGAWSGGGSLGAGAYNFTTITLANGQVLTVTNPCWLRANGYIDIQPGAVVQVTGGDPHAVPYKGGGGGTQAVGSAGGGGGGGHNGTGAAGGAVSGAAGGAGGVGFDNLSGWAQNDYSSAQGGAAGGAGGQGMAGNVYGGNGSNGAAVAGPGYDYNNGTWQYTTLTINTGAVFTGTSHIYVQGDCTIAGDFVGTGRGYAGGVPTAANVPDRTKGGAGQGPGGGGGGESADIAAGGGGAAATGGGGGHGGAGGPGTNSSYRQGGAGGAQNDLAGTTSPVAGSGGGAGGANNNTEGGTYGDAQGGAGGPGGASVYFHIGGRLLGAGRIITDGLPGADARPGGSSGGQTAGGGGGGAGGHVRIDANIMQCSVQVYARGGKGGNSIMVPYAGNAAGGAGGGGGGVIYVVYGLNNGFLTVADASPGAGGDPVQPPGQGWTQAGYSGAQGQWTYGQAALTAVAGGAAGPGGGVLKLTAPTVQNNGTVRARGGDGGQGATNGGVGGGGGGAGAGGALWRQAEAATGGGAWDVAPGNAGAGGTGAGAGGAAPSGRTRTDLLPLQTTGGGEPGPGGAAGKLVFGDALINGTVRAPGAPGAAGQTGAGGRGTGGGGGGAGGAPWLAGGTLAGGGTVSALGGAGGAAGGFAGAGGQGGLGRLRFDVAHNTFAGTLQGVVTSTIRPTNVVPILV